MEKPAIRRGWLLALVGSAALSVAQDAKKIETAITLDFASKYVWHGLNLVNDSVFQPGASFTMCGITLSLWGSMELTNWNAPNYVRTPKGRFAEIDTTLQYDGTYRSMGWNVGIVDYQFPGTGWERYREWFAGVSFEEVWGSPWLAVYTGNNDRTGTYATLGVSHSLPVSLGKTQAIDLGVELTYGDARSNRYLYGWDGSSFTDVHLCASADFDLGRGWTATPSLNYATLLHGGILRGAPRRSNVWACVSFGFKF